MARVDVLGPWNLLVSCRPGSGCGHSGRGLTKPPGLEGCPAGSLHPAVRVYPHNSRCQGTGAVISRVASSFGIQGAQSCGGRQQKGLFPEVAQKGPWWGLPWEPSSIMLSPQSPQPHLPRPSPSHPTPPRPSRSHPTQGGGWAGSCPIFWMQKQRLPEVGSQGSHRPRLSPLSVCLGHPSSPGSDGGRRPGRSPPAVAACPLQRQHKDMPGFAGSYATISGAQQILLKDGHHTPKKSFKIVLPPGEAAQEAVRLKATRKCREDSRTLGRPSSNS